MSQSPTIDLKKVASLREKLSKKPDEQKLSYCIITFGCQMNYADSEKIHMLLLQAGLSKVETWQEANIVIFNTCSVRQKAEDRVFGGIREIVQHNKKNGTEIRVGVTGCMTRKTGIHKKYYDYQGRKNTTRITPVVAQDNTTSGIFNSDDALFLRSDAIDFIFRIEETASLTSLLSLVFDRDIGQDDRFNDYLSLKQKRNEQGFANVIIQTGCDNYCTFCIVPYTRGGEVSRPIDDIYEEVREAVKSGAKEVTLLGQNVNSYGKKTRLSLWNAQELTWETPDVRTPFRELLEKLSTIGGLDRIRFTSSNPHDMTKDILDAHFDLAPTCPYLHFALQSGDDTVLKKMNRKHTYWDFKIMVEYLRSKDPLFSISTDIIVGFPGETQEQFEHTVRAFRECVFDFAYIARYSPRAHTYAAKMKEAIDHKEKARRWSILNEELRKSVQARNQLMLERTEEVLVSRIEKDGSIGGRTRNFKEVFFTPKSEAEVGDLIPVHIQKVDGWVLRGEQK